MRNNENRETKGVHRLQNADEIRRILLHGHDRELQELRDFHGVSEEKAQFLRDCARYEDAAETKAQAAFMQRELFQPVPSPEELRFGNYFDCLQPQVHDAVIALRKKGYPVLRAGFENQGTTQALQFAVDVQLNDTMLAGLSSILAERGISMTATPKSLEISCKKALSLEDSGQLWRDIVDALDDLGNRAPENTQPSAAAFRKSMEKGTITVESPEELRNIFRDALNDAQRYVDALDERAWKALGEVYRLQLTEEELRAVALIVGGLKPATSLDVLPGKEKMIIDVLRTCGLVVEVRPSTTAEGERVECLVANNTATLAALQHASASEHHREYGELMGYPASAVDAFMDSTTLRTNSSDINADMRAPTMRLSRSHWPEELRVVARWSYFTKLVEGRV